MIVIPQKAFDSLIYTNWLDQGAVLARMSSHAFVTNRPKLQVLALTIQDTSEPSPAAVCRITFTT